MPTKNRRVATYLPQEIDDRLAAFKADRGIEGDSQALITILSEFLGVAQQVTYSVNHSSTFATKDELAELNLKMTHLAEQIQGFDRRLNQVVSKAASELKDELLGELPKPEVAGVSPGQLELLSNRAEEQEVETLSQPANMPNELLGGFSGSALAKRFSKKKPVSRHTVERHRDLPDLPQWSAAQDPQGIAWEYRDKKYYPIQYITGDSLSEP